MRSGAGFWGFGFQGSRGLGFREGFGVLRVSEFRDLEGFRGFRCLGALGV